jgi:hypothetical protein
MVYITGSKAVVGDLLLPKAQQSAAQFSSKQTSFLLNTTHDIGILFGTSDQVRHDVVDFAVRNVLEDIVAVLTQRERDVITHAEQLAKEDLVAIDLVLLHFLKSFTHRCFIVCGDHQRRFVKLRENLGNHLTSARMRDEIPKHTEK